MLAFFAVTQVHGAVSRQQALDAFRVAQAAAVEPKATSPAQRQLAPPDQTQWAENRIMAYRASLQAPPVLPQGVLRIESLALEVPIFADTSELNLNRGVGWIEGTDTPGETGNVGIAGHRDGFFRVLKDISVGDVIDVESLSGPTRYRVAETFIVEPEDVYVLDRTTEPSLTLVTCYPFYFVGHAPQRFIVRGVLVDADSGADG
ncbi:MAG: class D sortase [Gammaproteobacteria bacterium]